MPKKTLTGKAYINKDEKNILLLEINEKGEVTYYLPESERKNLADKMLKNIGNAVSLINARRMAEIG